MDIFAVLKKYSASKKKEIAGENVSILWPDFCFATTVVHNTVHNTEREKSGGKSG